MRDFRLVAHAAVSSTLLVSRARQESAGRRARYRRRPDAGLPGRHRSTMETITLDNGVEMPALGLGVFQTPPDETRAAVDAALAAGYRHVDTAAAYGNERQVGEAVHAAGLDRSEVFLETKIWISDYGYDETLHGF